MNEHEIRKAFDTIQPAPDAKSRMLRRILSAASAQQAQTHYEARAEKRNWMPLIATIVVLVFAVSLGVMYLHSAATRLPSQLGDGEGEQTVSGEDITSNLDYLDLDLIEPILEKYRTIILQGGDMELCEEAGISSLTMHITSPDQLGYAIRDLDGNGALELIITDGKVIFDLYSLSGEDLVHVFSGAERNSYELCEGNFIRNIASSGAADTVYTFSQLDGTDLIWYEKVIYDGADPAGPWFSSHFQVSMTRIAVDEDTACAILDSYQTISIQMEPLGQISLEYVVEEDGVQYLILPISKSKICVQDENKKLLGNVDIDLLKAAEETLSAQISQYARRSGFYLQNVEGQLYLYVEVIVNIDPPVSADNIALGCGIDHEHKFFGERITKQ